MRRDLKVIGTASPITVGEGIAVVRDNIHYWNTEREYMEIPTPVEDMRIDCIVLRTDWERQTVRLARIGGVEGEGPPALNAGAKRGIRGIVASIWRWLLSLFRREAASVERGTYDTALAQCTITLDGIVTVTDTWEAK